MSLESSRQLCKEITKREARNFYYGFLFLPRAKREALYAIYAFMRKTDDLVDIPGEVPAAQALEAWQKALQSVYRGEAQTDPILPAFQAAVRDYIIPQKYFDLLIEGVRMDLESTRYENFEKLYAYCYRVGSVVGLTTLCVLEGDRQENHSEAEALGIAFQMTNILRDIKEDASRGRIYLPQEELRRFSVGEEEILQSRCSESFRKLMQFQWERVSSYYEKARPLISKLRNRSSKRAIAVMTEVYRGVLDKIRKLDYPVLQGRVALTRPEKLSRMVRGVFCHA